MKEIKVPLFIIDDNEDYSETLKKRIEESVSGFEIVKLNPNSKEDMIGKIMDCESPFLILCDHNLTHPKDNQYENWEKEPKGKDEVAKIMKNHPYALFSIFIYYSQADDFDKLVFEINEELIEAGCVRPIYFFHKNRVNKMVRLMPIFYKNILDSFEMFSQNGILFPLWLSKRLDKS